LGLLGSKYYQNEARSETNPLVYGRKRENQWYQSYAPINVRPAGWGEAGQGGGIWHSNKILCQFPYPRDSSAGQIDRTQGQLKLFQRDFSSWIIHKGSILSLFFEIIGRLQTFFDKIYSRFSFEVWICLRRHIQQLQMFFLWFLNMDNCLIYSTCLSVYRRENACSCWIKYVKHKYNLIFEII
jgi:hypothetical protein